MAICKKKCILLAASYWHACYYPQCWGGRCMKGYSGTRFSSLETLSDLWEPRSCSKVTLCCQIAHRLMSWNRKSAEHQSESDVHLLQMTRHLVGEFDVKDGTCKLFSPVKDWLSGWSTVGIQAETLRKIYEEYLSLRFNFSQLIFKFKF